MYQSIGLGKIFTLFALIAGAVAVGTFWLMPPTNLLGWWKPVSFGMTASSFLIIGIGQSFLFPMLCRLWGLRDIAPDISGDWRVELESNWPVIAQMSGLPTPKSSTVLATIRVKARLLRVTVTLDADTKYSTSKAVCVSAVRDEDAGDLRLYYVYANHTPNPEATDSSHHFGAALVDFRGQGAEMTGSGLYWNNRNWTKGLNAAGTMRWERPS